MLVIFFVLLSVLSSKRRTFVKYVISSTADYLLTMPPATREKLRVFISHFYATNAYSMEARERKEEEKSVYEKNEEINTNLVYRVKFDLGSTEGCVFWKI